MLCVIYALEGHRFALLYCRIGGSAIRNGRESPQHRREPVLVSERHIAQQRRLLAWLERANREKSESAKVARDILETLEKIQTQYIAERDRLKHAPRPF